MKAFESTGRWLLSAGLGAVVLGGFAGFVVAVAMAFGLPIHLAYLVAGYAAGLLYRRVSTTADRVCGVIA